MQSALRGDGLGSSEQRSLLSCITHCLLCSDDAGICEAAGQILQQLLDADQPSVSGMGDQALTGEFIQLFYDHFVHWIVLPLSLLAALPDASSLARENHATKSAKLQICELMSFCVQSHGYRIKYFALRDDLLEKVLSLLRFRDQHLKLAAVRLIRVCIGLKVRLWAEPPAETRSTQHRDRAPTPLPARAPTSPPRRMNFTTGRSFETTSSTRSSLSSPQTAGAPTS